MSNIESTCLRLQKDNKKLRKEIRQLKSLNKNLIIALKSQHQPHMDYVFELDTTVTELLKEV